jgi:hypothetical protein
MLVQPPQAGVRLGSEILKVTSRVAQLVAKIAQLKEALRQRQQTGVVTGLLAQRFATTPERAGRAAADTPTREQWRCTQD